MSRDSDSGDDGDANEDLSFRIGVALIPFATTSGFIQYGSKLKRSPVVASSLEQQAAMVGAVLKILGPCRLSQSTTKAAMGHEFSARPFTFTNDVRADAIEELSKRLRTLVCHYRRVASMLQRPPWMIEVCAHMNDKSHIAAMKRPASAAPKEPPVAHTNDALENEEATTSDAEEPAAKRVQQDRCWNLEMPPTGNEIR